MINLLISQIPTKFLEALLLILYSWTRASYLTSSNSGWSLNFLMITKIKIGKMIMKPRERNASAAERVQPPWKIRLSIKFWPVEIWNTKQKYIYHLNFIFKSILKTNFNHKTILRQKYLRIYLILKLRENLLNSSHYWIFCRSRQRSYWDKTWQKKDRIWWALIIINEK